ncbi:response regulator transcription factor [Acaryochloris sp. IP29b_bin.137]|uniref:response regulator n=1 Tax=Acaryochloris sp. IP29b_bin.137 TaxID=2969217 RepID=UPI0026293F53|nr:response regulator transcription factor [Acaryochloris sp. IP29b_bin.137]
MIRILLVDDQKVIRQGLKALLESETDFQIVGLAENGKIGIELAEQLQPDVALVDMHMPVMDGVAATENIRQRCPNTKVLLLSSADDDKCIADALSAGAMGYLLKDASSEEVANAIRSVHMGYTQLSPGLLEKVMNRNPSPAEVAQTTSDLTYLERELLRLLKEPHSLDLATINAFIALVVSPNDVKRLVPHLRQKLQRQPDHVLAYFILGTLVYEHQHQAKVALTCWRKGFKQALDQKLSLETLLLFCQSIALINADEAFSRIRQVLARQEPHTPAKLLGATAERVFGPESECAQFLAVTWQINQLNTLLDEHYPLKSKLDDVNTGFATLGKNQQVYSL